jgi:lysophospholipase L1-like esterase
VNKGFKYFLTVGITVVVILCVIEITSRIILTIIYNRGFDSSLIIGNKYFTSSGLKANASGVVWGKSFHTDEFGGRKNARFDKAKKKWLFIGDSVTEGVGVNDSCTFSSLCSREFPQYYLLNISLIGYSAFDYVNVLQSFLAKDTTVELVTLFYCLNDVYGKASIKDLPVMARHDLIGTANSFLQNRLSTYKLLKLLVYRNSDSYFRYDSQFYKRDNPRFVEAMSYLHECDSICRSKNVFFQVVVLPYKSQLMDKGSDNTPQQLVKEFCQKDSLEFSDATEFIAKHNNTSSLYLFADEIHFSAKGHRVIADYLSQ